MIRHQSVIQDRGLWKINPPSYWIGFGFSNQSWSLVRLGLRSRVYSCRGNVSIQSTRTILRREDPEQNDCRHTTWPAIWMGPAGLHIYPCKVWLDRGPNGCTARPVMSGAPCGPCVVRFTQSTRFARCTTSAGERGSLHGMQGFAWFTHRLMQWGMQRFLA